MLVLGIGPGFYKGKRDRPTRAFLLCQSQYVPSSHDISNSNLKCDLAAISSYDASHRAPAIEPHDSSARLGPSPLTDEHFAMSWTTVNITAYGPRRLQNIQNGDHSSVKPVNAVASKFRVNILHNAEKLVGNCPKRKRRASKPAPTEPTPKKSNRSQSNKVEASVLKVVKTDLDEASTSPKRRSARLQTPSTDNLYDLPSADHPAIQACASDPASPELLQQATIEDTPTDVIIEHRRVEPLSMVAHSNSANTLDSPVEVKTSSALYSQTKPVIDVPLEDSSTNFDDFDDSVFEGPFQACLGADSSSPSTFSSTTSVSIASPASEKPDSNKQNLYSTPQVAVKHPNGAPFAPFMHPCLLDSLDAEALILNTKDAATPSLKHTCFRAAELLRLSKCFKSSPIAQDNDLAAELFATVKEVHYANSQGQGQGLVLADVFFPDKQPFIITSSRIPYSVRTLVPQSQTKGGMKSPVKATIRVSGPSSSFASRPTQRRSSPVRSSQAAPHIRLQVPSNPEFEVIDVRTSS